MTQLTEERFEQILTENLAPLATEENVRREVREGIEELARMVSSGFEDIRDRLDVRERVVRVGNGLQRIAKELHISL